MASARWVGAGLVALSATSFGAMAIFALVAYAGGADVTAVLFLRFAIASVAMAALTLATRRRWPSRRNATVLALMGGVGYVAQSMCFFSALRFASAGLVALLLYLYPFLVALIGVAFLGERLTRRRSLAMAAALVGTALTLGEGLGGSGIGVALGVATAVIYSIYIVAGSRVLAAEDALASSTVVMLAAALVFGGLVLATGPRFPVGPAAWMACVAIALVSTAVAMATFFAGIQRLGAADAATLSTLEPVVTFILAAVFLGEAVSALQIIGGAIVLGAVIALARDGAGSAQSGSGSTRSR